MELYCPRQQGDVIGRNYKWLKKKAGRWTEQRKFSSKSKAKAFAAYFVFLFGAVLCIVSHYSLGADYFYFLWCLLKASLNNQYWIVSVIVSLLRNELFFCTHCLRFGTKQRKQSDSSGMESPCCRDGRFARHNLFLFHKERFVFLFCFTLIIQLKGITVHQNSLRPQCNRMSFWNTTRPHRQIAFRCSF